MAHVLYRAPNLLLLLLRRRRRDAAQMGGSAARVPRVPVRRQWPCTLQCLFHDRARRLWTIQRGMLGPAPSHTTTYIGVDLSAAPAHVSAGSLTARTREPPELSSARAIFSPVARPDMAVPPAKRLDENCSELHKLALVLFSHRLLR